MTYQLALPVAKRHQGTDGLSVPLYHSPKNHSNHCHHNYHNDGSVQGKFRNQIIRFAVNQGNTGIGGFFQIFLGIVFFINFRTEGGLFFLVQVANRILLCTVSQCRKIFRIYNADTKTGLIRCGF